MQKLRKEDDVIVIAGRSKGVIGRVLRVLTKDRLIVEGVNVVRKHVRPNPNNNEPGGIKEKEATIAISNVAIYNHQTKKADRVGFTELEDGKKVRVFKSSGEQIDI